MYMGGEGVWPQNFARLLHLKSFKFMDPPDRHWKPYGRLCIYVYYCYFHEFALENFTFFQKRYRKLLKENLQCINFVISLETKICISGFFLKLFIC